MRLNGVWHLCDDRFVRPVIRGEVETADGSWAEAPFLVDIGADRTVFSVDILAALALTPLESSDQLGGVGGLAASIVVRTRVRLPSDDGGKVLFRGEFAAVTEPESLDMSVLGRDITNLFAVIVDRPGDVVCLLRERHKYSIDQD